MAEGKPGAGAAPWRRGLHEIIFEADTRGCGHVAQGHDADAVPCRLCGPAL